jgi:predicted alpha-1,6-mannanase (GH76 family)
MLLFVGLLLVTSARSQFRAVPPDLAIDSFNNAFYHVSNGVGYYAVDSSGKTPDRGTFWQYCEMIEVIEDAYERSKNPVYGRMIGELINGLNQVVSRTEDWASWNKYNDDVMWGVIALVRSFQLTGNRAHLTQAEVQFNAVWARGWDQNKGGMYWNTDKISKNACVNGPAAIAGFLLARSTTGTGFGQQAQQAIAWLRATLYVPSTGQVYDHIDPDGKITNWAFTYNQGTFIGASAMYAQASGQSSFMADAGLAATWAMTHLTGQHAPNILQDECDANNGGGDGCGFKGIFARWCNYYIKATRDTKIGNWLALNAQTAWDNRNSAGITWAEWWQRTPSTKLFSWECSSAAAVTQTQNATLLA